MVRGPRARPVPKNKVVVEDGESLKAALKAGNLNGGANANDMVQSRKRGRPSPAVTEARRAEKKAKLDSRIAARREHLKETVGTVLTLGQGDTGQLGLGPDIMERSKPAIVKGVPNVISVCAGGMHTVCVTLEGKVFTFGKLKQSDPTQSTRIFPNTNAMPDFRL